MVERWFVYVHDLGTVATGAANRLVDVPLQLQNDAPFVLRARSFAVLQTDSVDFSAVQDISSRFRDANYGYRADDLVPAAFEPSPLGTDGPVPYAVYPELRYPAGSTINLDCQNNGDAPAHFYAVYHGVKLFGDAEYAYTYPEKVRGMDDFSYVLSVPNLLVGETRHNVIKTIRQDADYAIRGGYLTPTNAAFNEGGSVNLTNLFVKVYDHHRRSFSNDWVPANSIFGWAQPFSPFRNSIPGLVVPEWYLPANDWFEMEFMRVDSAITGAGTVDIAVQFRGSKVYRA